MRLGGLGLVVALASAPGLVAACKSDGANDLAACDDSKCENDPRKTAEERASCEETLRTSPCSLELEAFAACKNSNRVCAPEKKTDEVRTGQAVEEKCGVQSARFANCIIQSLGGDGGVASGGATGDGG